MKSNVTLLLGVGVEHVAITGQGTINGNKVFDARGEERMRGPHTVLFGNSKNITLRDISIKDAANYAVMLEFTSQVEVRGVKITGGWDGVHFRGWKDNPCRDISITNCEFYTGDDCIAGWWWENTLVSNCIINSSCKCTDLKVAAKPLSAIATIEGGSQEGLAKVELTIAGRSATRWVWLQANEKKEVAFTGLSTPPAGRHPVQCGQVTREVTVQ
jgi:hypothetical protein